MRTIIAGSRTVTDYSEVSRGINLAPWKPTVVISGTASGVDTLGERWAVENGIKVERHPADWKNKGRVAGLLRNIEMAKVAEALILIWDGSSRGSRHMLEAAKKRDLRIFVHFPILK